MRKKVSDRVMILGAGPAGYTAALYAARANLEPRLIAGMQPGGQLTITTDVENWPSEMSIEGPNLVEKMRAQAEYFGAEIVYDTIISVDLSKRPFTCIGDSGESYFSKTLIICTGAQARWLGLPSEEAYRGRGVSACATCDGFFFRGKEVVVVGGGNSAVEEAIYLTNHATRVTLVHRRDRLRAAKIAQDRLFQNSKIEVVWDSVVEEVVGDGLSEVVTGVRVRHLKSGANRLMRTDGVFVAIGHTPVTELFRGKLTLDPDGYIVTKPDSTATEVPGVFAAGDVKDKVFRQAVTAAGMGCMAALEADRFLALHEPAATARRPGQQPMTA